MESGKLGLEPVVSSRNLRQQLNPLSFNKLRTELTCRSRLEREGMSCQALAPFTSFQGTAFEAICTPGPSRSQCPSRTSWLQFFWGPAHGHAVTGVPVRQCALFDACLESCSLISLGFGMLTWNWTSLVPWK